MVSDQEIILLITKVMKKEGRMNLPAQGTSMFPVIQKGDICTFVQYEPAKLKKGDIVLFRGSSEKLIAHRFYNSLYINNQLHYLFKGDTNLGFDEPITKECIIGKLTCVQKSNKKIRMEDILIFIWGRMILSLPILSNLLRKYIQRIKSFQF